MQACSQHKSTSNSDEITCACGICTVCMQVATNTATTKQTHARQLCHEGNDSVEPVRQVATAVRVRLAPAVFGVQPCRVDYIAPKPRKVSAQSIDLQRGEQRVEGSENANQWRSSSSSRHGHVGIATYYMCSSYVYLIGRLSPLLECEQIAVVFQWTLAIADGSVAGELLAPCMQG